MGLNWYIPISDTSLFQFVHRAGTDPTVHCHVQTDTVSDNRHVIAQMGKCEPGCQTGWTGVDCTGTCSIAC